MHRCIHANIEHMYAYLELRQAAVGAHTYLPLAVLHGAALELHIHLQRNRFLFLYAIMRIE